MKRKKFFHEVFIIKLNRSVVFVVSALFILIFHAIILKKSQIQKIQIPKPFHFSQVFIAVFITNESNTELASLSYKRWGKFLSLYSPKSRICFYSQKNIPFLSDRKILNVYVPSPPLNRPYSEGYLRMNGFYSAMTEFLDDYSIMWFLRTTDTALINLKSFSEYISYLESILSPDGNIIMKGELKFIFNSFYLDGNAGFLMSREAVEFTYKAATSFELFSDPMLNDDVLISEYWEELSEPFVFSSKAILGTKLSPKTSRRIQDRIYAGLPICPENSNVMRVKDIAIWSSTDGNYTALTYGREALNTIPEYVFFKVSSNGYTTLCVDANSPNPCWIDSEPYLN